MSVSKEISRFKSFLKRLFRKLPGEAAEAKEDLDRAIKFAWTARPFLPSNLQDEADATIAAMEKIRKAADLVEEL